MSLAYHIQELIANVDRSQNFTFRYPIGLYRDVWIAAIASSTTSLATRTAAICVRFQGRRVRRVYVTAGGIGTAWSRVIGNGSGMGYGNHAEDPVWVMCIFVTSQRKKHTGALAIKQ